MALPLSRRGSLRGWAQKGSTIVSDKLIRLPPERAGCALLRRAQVASLLGISSRTLTAWVRRSAFPAPVAPGVRPRWTRQAVERWLSGQGERMTETAPVHRGWFGRWERRPAAPTPHTSAATDHSASSGTGLHHGRARPNAEGQRGGGVWAGHVHGRATASALCRAA